MAVRFCNNAKTGLKLNESLSNSGEYILEGVFAELGVMNVNHRIYTEEEYLKHLQYLRDDVSKGDLLGELDHPEDRLEVKMQGVSHQIIDIWYDQPTKTVMGKIKLLNTPNGQIAKSVVDAGIPLHISSRATGTINKDNTISIQQIYTYDIVAKPGFSKATLHRVNESEGPKYSDGVIGFLKRSEKMEEENQALVYGINEEALVNTISATANLRKEAVEINEGKSKDIDMEELSKHVNEAEQQNDGTQAAASAGLATPSMDPVVKEDKEQDAAKAEGDNTDNNKDQNADDASKKGDNKEGDDKETNDPYEIVSAEVETSDDSSKDDEGKDGKKDDDADNTDGDKDGDKEDDKDKDTEGEGDKTTECGQTDKPSNECDKTGDADADKKPLNDAKAKSEDALAKAEKGLGKLDDILAELKKKKEKKVDESVNSQLSAQYPFTQVLNESAKYEFSQLDEAQKNKVVNYLAENKVTNPVTINSVWKNALNENAKQEPVWLLHAAPEYRKLYESASDIEKKNLEYTASVLVFESQRDVDLFWQKSGLKTRKERQMLNEAFVANVPQVSQAQQVYSELPYSKESVQMYMNWGK